MGKRSEPRENARARGFAARSRVLARLVSLAQIRRACSQASANMEFDRNCLQFSYALFFRLIHISLTFSERDVGTALSYSDKNHFEASISRKTYFKSSIWKYMATAPFSKTPRSCAVTLFVGFSWRHDGQDHRDKQTPKFTPDHSLVSVSGGGG